MKTFPSVAVILSVLWISAGAAEVKVGQSTGEVRQILGAPRGVAHAGGREIFYYDRGEIEASNGLVSRVALRTEDEQASLEKKRTLEAARLRDESEIRQARLSAEGEKLKSNKLSDPSFLASPLSHQVAFWEDFSKRYPSVSSAELLLDVRSRFTVEVEEKRKQAEQAQRLADLEARVAAAENDTRLRRMADYDRLSFPASYWSYHSSQRYFPAPEPAKVVTRMYEFPIPYATSPGMPPVQPVYRKEINQIPGFLPEDTSDKSRPSYLRRF